MEDCLFQSFLKRLYFLTQNLILFRKTAQLQNSGIQYKSKARLQISLSSRTPLGYKRPLLFSIFVNDFYPLQLLMT